MDADTADLRRDLTANARRDLVMLAAINLPALIYAVATLVLS